MLHARGPHAYASPRAPFASRALPGLLLLATALAPARGWSADPTATPPDAIALTYGKGVTFRSANSPFSINIRARTQLRFTETLGLDDANNVDDHAEEFQVRRARLLFAGTLFSKDIEYYVQLGFSNLDMEPDRPVPLRDATITYKRFRDLTLRFGQMKVPFALQRRTSSGRQQFVDRSLTTSRLNLDRDVGIELMSEDLGGFGGRFGYEIGVYGGDGRNRTSNARGVLSVARLTLRPFGSFDELVEADLLQHRTPKIALSGAVARNSNTAREDSTLGTTYKEARFTYDHAEVDLHAKWRGMSLVAEWMLRRADKASVQGVKDPTLLEHSRSAWGAYAQVGVLVRPTVELLGRWAIVRPLGSDRSQLRNEREFGGGVSWYLHGHDFKVQVDCFQLQRDGDLDAFRARVQTQMWF